MTTVMTNDATPKTLTSIRPPQGTTRLAIRLRASHGQRSASFVLTATAERGSRSLDLRDEATEAAAGRPWRAWLEVDGDDVLVMVADRELRDLDAPHLVTWTLDTDKTNDTAA